MNMIDRSVRVRRVKPFICMVAVFLLTAVLANASSEVKVVMIAAEGGVAVTKEKKGRLKLVRPGDRIAPYGTVTSISDGRIVLVNNRTETVFIDLRDGIRKIKRVSRVHDLSSEHKVVNSEAINVGGESGGKNIGVFNGQKKNSTE